MRKLALIALLAIVGAMVPMSTASSQPAPGSLDGVGTIMLINPGVGNPIGVWIEIESGEWVKTVVSSPGKQEVQIPKGTHNFTTCVETPAPSADQTCPVPSSPWGAPGSFTIHSNDILNGLICSAACASPASRLSINENDTEQTEVDHTKFTAFNGAPAPFDVCIDGQHVISLPANAGGAALPGDTAEVPAKDGEEQSIQLFSAFLAAPFPGTCTGGVEFGPRGLPPGANTVLTLPDGLFGVCTGSCVYQIFPGEEPPSSSQQISEFCAVVLDAANITPWLQDLFAEVEVGNPDTYPSPDKVEKVITRIAELLEKGKETAPDDIIDAWLTATAAFVETGRLATANYDLEALPQDDLRALVDGIDNPPADDEEAAAATAELTAWVTANCFATTAIEAEPNFTG